MTVFDMQPSAVGVVVFSSIAAASESASRVQRQRGVVVLLVELMKGGSHMTVNNELRAAVYARVTAQNKQQKICCSSYAATATRADDRSLNTSTKQRRAPKNVGRLLIG